MAAGLVHGLFFLSGAAGLLWQLTWVRAFGRVFGNTVSSAAVVSGVFVAALGLGAMWAGARVDREGARPLRLYAVLELSIAALGLAGALALPALAPWLASTASYAPDAAGWLRPSGSSQAARFAAALLWVGVPAALMGGTLSVLIRSRACG